MRLKSYLRSHIISISLFLTCFVMGFASSNMNWGGSNWVDILEADAKGYYAYLPAVFIYQDLNFGFYKEIEQEKYYNKSLLYEYRSFYKEKTINKYYCGTAIAEMPFFLIAHLCAKLLGYPADGYSKIYLILINMAAIFYMLVGFIFLTKTLKIYKIRDNTIAFIIPVLAFGTNIFVYTACDPGMSHIYSFAFFNVFIYCFKSFCIKQENHYLLWSAAALGIITLIRPVNALLVLSVPFLCGSKENSTGTWAHITSKPGLLLSAMLLFFAIVSIQPFIYYLSCGSPFVYTYGTESFNFAHPHMFDILFSYRKGLFLYTPVLSFAVFGLIRMWRLHRFETTALFSFLFFITYFLSSWWLWWYGASFSSRVFLEFIPFFALPICFFIDSFGNGFRKKMLFAIFILLTLMCQIQIYQYRYYKISSEYMTKEKYWNAFLRIDKLIK